MNIQSLKPKLDMLIHHMQVSNIGMVFVTETWTEDGNELEHQYIKANINTAGYNMLIQSRENQRGGGIAIRYKSHLQVKKLIFNNYISFKLLTITLNISSKSYLFSTIYRAPYSTKQPTTILTFLEEFPDHIWTLLRNSRNINILGDFNIPWNIADHPDTISMQEVIDMYDLKQHIHTEMHRLGKTLDWLISNNPTSIIDITNKDLLSDHCIIEWKFQVSHKIREKMQTSRRHLNNIDEKKFKEDLKKSLEIDAGKTLQQNYNNYMEAITKTMNKHAPLITKTKTKKDHNPWFEKDSQRLKTQWRMAERRWIKSKNHEDLLEYKHLNMIYKKHLHHAKKTSILHELNDNKNKTRNLYNILRSLTKQKEENPMPSTRSPSNVPDTFADFFLNKIKNQGTVSKSEHKREILQEMLKK